MGDRQQRLLWLDIPHGECTGSTRSTGSDDVFGVGKPVGAVGLHTGKIKVSGRLSGKRSSYGLVRCLRMLVCALVPTAQAGRPAATTPT
jgi:hypothetical protein